MKKFLEFYKSEATGNDFVIIDLRESKNKTAWKKALRVRSVRDWVHHWCNRNFGIGADGVIFLTSPATKKNSLAWDFYNSDGSSAEMCGNASRCVGIFESQKKSPKREHILLETKAGVIRLLLNRNSLWVHSQLPSIRVLNSDLTVKGLKKKWKGVFLNSGVPHFVTEIHGPIERTMLGLEAKAIKKNKVFGKKSTNVTFVYRNERENFVVTHERGVEDFTLSCGTGAAAAARYLADKYGLINGCRIELPGGSVEVHLKSQVELVGPARIIYRGEYGV